MKRFTFTNWKFPLTYPRDAGGDAATLGSNHLPNDNEHHEDSDVEFEDFNDLDYGWFSTAHRTVFGRCCIHFWKPNYPPELIIH